MDANIKHGVWDWFTEKFRDNVNTWQDFQQIILPEIAELCQSGKEHYIVIGHKGDDYMLGTTALGIDKLIMNMHEVAKERGGYGYNCYLRYAPVSDLECFDCGSITNIDWSTETGGGYPLCKDCEEAMQKSREESFIRYKKTQPIREKIEQPLSVFIASAILAVELNDESLYSKATNLMQSLMTIGVNEEELQELVRTVTYTIHLSLDKWCEQIADIKDGK